MDRLHAGLRDKVERSGQAGQAVAVQRACFQAGRILLRLRLRERLNAASADLERPDLHAFRDAHAAGPLRAVQSLVAGKAQHRDPHALHIDGDTACCLGSVHDQKQAARLAERADLFQIEHVPGQVGRVVADDGFRLRPHQRPEIAVIHAALFIRAHEIQRNALIRLQTVQGTQHGIVLQIGGDDVIPCREQTAQRDVQRLRGIGGEDDPGGVAAPEQSRRLAAGVVHRAGRFQRPAVTAPGGIAHPLHGGNDRVDHALRFMICCRRIIQIDHAFFSSFSASSAAPTAPA